MQLHGSADYLTGKTSAASLLGISPAAQSRAAGASTPPVTAAGGDHQMVPWSPDSIGFWVAVIGGATLLGIAGADVKFRLFKRTAQAQVGKT